MIGIDLFSGAGGMSLGAIAAGIHVALAVEVDEHAALTYAHNHPKTAMFRDDVRKLNSRHLRNIKRGQDGTVVFGGPPCQGFSYSNQRTRSVRNPNNWLFREFVRIVKQWTPDWVVFENVKGITDTEGGIFLDQVLDHFDRLRYTCAHAVLDAADFGVPQHRQRLFLIGSRHGVNLTLPKPRRSRAITVNEAIGDLPPLENGASTNWMPYGAAAPSAYGQRMRGRRQKSPNHLITRNAEHIVRRYRFIPEGGNWEDIPARLMRNYEDRSRCHTGIYHRLHGDRPSLVIGNYRKNMLIHPKADRGLSVREAARIQSFPDSYEFVGSIGFQQQQVGNAVPPLLAKAVFQCVTAGPAGAAHE